MDTFGKEALETHNKFRAAHQAPALTWSSALARDAEAWAKQIARDGRLRHDDTSDGENVFMVFGREIDGSDAVNSWYSEVKDYDFNNPGFQPKTGHFTQVVWKGSEELGIGKAKSADGKMFVVGRYRPAGNNVRAFHENVFSSKVGIEIKADITFLAIPACGLKLQSTPDNSNLQGKSKKVRVIGSLKKIASFYCKVNILITFNRRNVK